MILALADLLAYVTRRGKYAHTRLVALNAELATPEMFSRLSGEFKDGDLIFVHPLKSLGSWSIMYVTNGPWSHVGGLSSLGTVIEATTGGMQENPASKYFDGLHYVAVVHLPIERAAGHGIAAFGRALIGAPYNWMGVIRLFLLIVFGETDSYHPKLSVDILLSLILVWFITPWRPIRTYAPG